jgi:hypothetical protein
VDNCMAEFKAYRVWPYREPADKEATKVAEQLRNISNSRMCLAYSLGAMRAGLGDGERVLIRIDEYIAQCAMLGIDQDFAAKEGY